MGDDIISQTINQPSYSSDFLPHFPLHNEPNFLLETISYSLKEHTIGVDQFTQGEETNIQVKTYVPIISRNAFWLLNSYTYYSLYPDIFYPYVVKLSVPD